MPKIKNQTGSPLVIERKRLVLVMSRDVGFRTHHTTILRSHYRIVPAQRQTMLSSLVHDQQPSAIVVDLDDASISFPILGAVQDATMRPLPVLGVADKVTREFVLKAVRGGVLDIVLKERADPEEIRMRMRQMIANAACVRP